MSQPKRDKLVGDTKKFGRGWVGEGTDGTMDENWGVESAKQL